MNKLSLIGSCQQVVSINKSAIKSHIKIPKWCIIIFQNLPIVWKYSRKNYSTANHAIYICPTFPNLLSCMLNSFESQPLRLSTVPSFHKMYPIILQSYVIIEDSP